MSDKNEIIQALSEWPRRLPTRLLYNGRGAELFEEITQQVEYFPTRDEVELLTQRASQIATIVGPNARLIEFGAGDGSKASLLLDAMESPRVYVAVDVACEQLRRMWEEKDRRYPNTPVVTVCKDFTKLDGALTMFSDTMYKDLVLFAGGTLGNFERPEAVRLLRHWRGELGSGAVLVLGVSLPQNLLAETHRAYNDRAGVTEMFNKGILENVNEVGGFNFKPWKWRHVAFYNHGKQRVEMWLESTQSQVVTSKRRAFVFDKGERILTEVSYRYDLWDVVSIAGDAEWRMITYWPNAAQRYMLVVLRAE